MLQAAPGAGGILVDQPRVLARARPFLERHGSPTAARCTPGTCSPPPAADLYLLASVLHDWDDDHAARAS